MVLAINGWHLSLMLFCVSLIIKILSSWGESKDLSIILIANFVKFASTFDEVEVFEQIYLSAIEYPS